jgi:hypothetical protein
VQSQRTVPIVDDTAPTALGATLRVFGAEGPSYDREFDANLGRPAIHPSGETVAVATRPPDATLSLFSVPDGEPVGEYTVRDRPLRVLGFHADGGDHYLYVGVRSANDPHLAMDADGDVAWESDRYWATRSIGDRLTGLRDRL